MDDLRRISALPLPTPQQYHDFADQLCWAHSWYKHLPLLQGGAFVVFLAPDAGAGYPPERPRLHYSWQTTAEYRQRFGQLDYMWRISPDQPFARDASAACALPQSLLDQCSVTLYPFVSTDANALEAIAYGLHADALERLRDGYPHVERARILAWHAAYMANVDAWAQLSEAEQEDVYIISQKIAAGTHSPASEPAAVRAYLHSDTHLRSVYNELQAREQAKVLQALHNLHTWLGENTHRAAPPS